MTDIASTPDGVHAMVPEDAMCAAARKLRAAYAITPGAPFVQREFGFYCLERWAEQGMPADVARAELFGYDPSGGRSIGGLDWCEAAFTPAFEEKVLEDRGEYELVQDFAGRHVLCFKGRRSGFMPEYVDHPVKDMQNLAGALQMATGPDNADSLRDAGHAHGLRPRGCGGYIPTCDHGVPEEVPYENYLHYRNRALEFA